MPTRRRCRFRHRHHRRCCHHHCCPSQATAAALPPHFLTPSLCHCAATIDHFGVGTKYHFAHVEPKIPKSSKKGSKRIKAQKLRNARQILDLATPDKIWPCSQKPKKNKGRHPFTSKVQRRRGRYIGLSSDQQGDMQICYMTNPPLRYTLFLSARASTGSVTSESKSVTSPVTNAKKTLTLRGS